MGQVGVENGEERFSCWAVFPVGVAAAFVPAGCVLIDVVILFAIVGNVVASFSEVLGIDFHIRRKGHLAPHVFASERRWVHSCYECRASGTTNSGVRIGVFVKDPCFSKTVYRGRFSVRIAIASEVVRAIVFTRYPKDVGLVGR